MSQLSALKCNICGFLTKTTDKIDMTGWASIGFIVRVRGDRKYEQSKKEVRKKILESLGHRLHVCPGCLAKFEGREMNLRMIGTRVAEVV